MVHIQLFYLQSERQSDSICSYHATVRDGPFSRTDMLGIGPKIVEVTAYNIPQYLHICHTLQAFLNENADGRIVTDTTQLFSPTLTKMTSKKGQKVIQTFLEDLCARIPQTEEIPSPQTFIRRFSEIQRAWRVHTPELTGALPS